MDSTGKNFDMNPETFTLENLFTMELHNFAETISDIVGSANKELSIEKSLHEVVTTWHAERFSIHKYVLIYMYITFFYSHIHVHTYIAAMNFSSLPCVYAKKYVEYHFSVCR